MSKSILNNGCYYTSQGDYKCKESFSLPSNPQVQDTSVLNIFEQNNESTNTTSWNNIISNNCQENSDCESDSQCLNGVCSKQTPEPLNPHLINWEEESNLDSSESLSWNTEPTSDSSEGLFWNTEPTSDSPEGLSWNIEPISDSPDSPKGLFWNRN